MPFEKFDGFLEITMSTIEPSFGYKHSEKYLSGSIDTNFTSIGSEISELYDI